MKDILTDVRIKNLKPRPDRYLVKDGGGLYLEVHPSGKKSWFFRYRLKASGRQEKVVFDLPYPDLSLAEARKKRDELKADFVDKGISPARDKQEQKTQRKTGLSKDPTVGEFAERYFQDVIARTYKNPVPIRRYIDNEIVPKLGEKKLREVRKQDIQELVYLKRDHGSPMAGVALHGLLKRMFDYADECHLVELNPAHQVARKYIGQARTRTRHLTAGEIKVYLRAVYQSNMRRQFKLALHLILLTLVRKGELLLAEWKNVDLDRREWLLPASQTKTGVPHIVYLSTQAVSIFEELKALASTSHLVMPGRGSLTRPFADNAINHALEALTLDMDAFTIHDMRRTASTRLHENGFKPDVIELALGHKIGGIRGVYNVAKYAEDRKAMLQWWADYVDSLMNEDKVIVGNFRRA